MFRVLVAVLGLVASLSILTVNPARAQEARLLDFWAEEVRLFGVAGAGQRIDHDLDARRGANFRTDVVGLDHADHKVGDLSLVYSPRAAGMPERFGIVSGLWGERWNLSEDMVLRFWVKVQDARLRPRWGVQLVDSNGGVATSEIRGVSGQWVEFSIERASWRTDVGFAWDSVVALEFEAELGNRARVHLDGVRFEGDGRIVGVTDKPMAQRMSEAAASRPARIADAFRREAMVAEADFPSTVRGQSHPQKLATAFAKMMMNQDLATANRLLREELEASSVLTVWSLYETPLYVRIYNLFSSQSRIHPGRLTPETEALLLQTLWERNEVENDIALTRQSTWWMQGSENHDLQAKASSISASTIFMNVPEYRDRIYPNHGYGAGYHYGHAGYYGPGVAFDSRHGGGRASLSDGRDYRPADHHRAWVAFFQEYIVERGRRGFFLEHASRGYAKHSLSFLHLATNQAGDARLEALWDEFYTVYWADWAQTSISGVRGGPKTRHQNDVGGPSDRETADLISFHMGGPGNAGIFHYWNLLDDYQLPEIVWRMALDREGMGAFTYLSRGVGEEENVWPRPLGNERSLLVDTEARFLRSTYVTPEYTLGTQMDHPAAVHSHLSIAARWHGMTFAQSPRARIVPVGLPDQPDENGRLPAEWDMELVLQSVHDESTLILQQARRWFAVHPEWFPGGPQKYDRLMGVWLGNAWDERVERDGWVFVRSGNAYAAVRPVTWDAAYERSLPSTGVGNQVFFNKPYDPPTVRLLTDSYSWNEAGTIMQLRDSFAPVLIEASTTEDHPTIEAFITDILDNRLELHKTVVPGYHILVYVGLGGDEREIVFNAGASEIPTIGGEYVNYSHPMTWDSPFMSSEYLSGVVTLRFGDDRMVIDLTD
jgi:hypothetical protein